MIKQDTSLSELYEADETAWLEAMADLIRRGSHIDLDYTHLEEYLSDTAKRDRREVKNRLTTLLAQVLKWVYQPDHRTRGWKNTIVVQRQELTDAIGRGVLRNHAESVLAKAYTDAVVRAMTETELPESAFPPACPYTVDQLLAFDPMSS